MPAGSLQRPLDRHRFESLEVQRRQFRGRMRLFTRPGFGLEQGRAQIDRPDRRGLTQ
jgi:hypothetical protein